MKKRTVAVFLGICLIASFALTMTGCGFARGAFAKLNERLDQAGTAAATFSENIVRPPQVEVPKEEDEAQVTVLVYMNGSNLETDAGEATSDIAEMIKAGYSSDVNVVIQTMGTKKWQDYNISSRKTQRYEITKSGLTLVDNSLKQLPCTESSTLRDFISWGAVNYPAQRYELILWDHGAGPVYGFGYDEMGDSEETLTLDEMRDALSSAGVYFDFIGMDCCIMSSIETCCALYDYCDYTILSEDFETGLGWNYTNWLKKLRNNPTMPTPELGKIIVDDMVSANEKDRDYGGSAILTVVDEGMMKVLFTAWTDFAYANQDALMGKNYSTTLSRARGGRSDVAFEKRGMFTDLFDYVFDAGAASMDDYYVVDIMATAQTIKSSESKALSSALKEAIVYTRSTSDDEGLSGLSVTLPYGDAEFYSELKRVFSRCGFDSKYISWLGNFVSARGAYDFQDFSGWKEYWNGWDSYLSYFDWNSWEPDNQDIWWDDFGWDDDRNSYEDSWNKWFLDYYEDYFARRR